jgi:hypothetical protein
MSKLTVALTLVGRRVFGRRGLVDGPAVGVGTVCTVERMQSATAVAERQVLIQVTDVRGETFIGRLMHRDGDLDMSKLRPGLVVLVAFDPAARERLSLPDDVLAVRASCTQPG